MVENPISALRSYFENHPEWGVASAYLFGSQAIPGRAHRESDVDVAVLLDWQRHAGRGERFDVRVRLTSELISVLHHNEVDLVVLNDAPPLFARAIVWEGIRLFAADPEADRDYVRNVQLRAADLAPWLERVRRRKLEAFLS
jgi:predicted nucleotidyltransferase